MTGREDIFSKAMNDGHSAAWDQEWAKAAGFYRTALEEFPHHPKALSNYGLALLESQQFDESLKAYLEVSSLTPKDPVVFERIAQIYEHQGKIKPAYQAAMQSAELYASARNMDKAMENWQSVIRIFPGHAQAQMNLALVLAKTGKTSQAAVHYLALASILQENGDHARAVEMVSRAMVLDPRSFDAKDATVRLRRGQKLPSPGQAKTNPGSQRLEEIRQLEPSKSAIDILDPIDFTRQAALTQLAEYLFENDESSKRETPSVRRGVTAILKGNGALHDQIENDKDIFLHLGQAIDALVKEKDDQAVIEFEKALDAGLNHAALQYTLGLLRSRSERQESAIRHLEHAVNHVDFSLASHLLLGKIKRNLGRLNEATNHYLEALKLADSQTVPPSQAEIIAQLYEPIIETQSQASDVADLEKVCDVVDALLFRPGWQVHIRRTRSQIPEISMETGPLPLAEVLIQTKSTLIIDAMSVIRKMARDGHLRSAMEEAYHSMKYAPTYLPLHLLISELLIQEGKTEEAILKLSVIADSYSSRGEAGQASRIWRKVIKFSPLNLESRNSLISQLLAQGLYPEALKEYDELAGIYSDQADMVQARQILSTALQISQQDKLNIDWTLHFLKKLADLNMQLLDWRQACQIYEQVRSISPDDPEVRKSLIDLYIRLGLPNQAYDEIGNYFTYLDASGMRASSIPFLENMLKEDPQQSVLLRSLAEEFHKTGNIEKAVEKLKYLSDTCLESGDVQGAGQALETIISMNPIGVFKYQTLLTSLKGKT